MRIKGNFDYNARIVEGVFSSLLRDIHHLLTQRGCFLLMNERFLPLVGRREANLNPRFLSSPKREAVTFSLKRGSNPCRISLAFLCSSGLTWKKPHRAFSKRLQWIPWDFENLLAGLSLKELPYHRVDRYQGGLV